jgi:hypothetical protein
MYKIIDLQIAGREFADGALFKTKEDVRKQLISYHSIDMNGHDLKILQGMDLTEVLEFGSWNIEKVNFKKTSAICLNCEKTLYRDKQGYTCLNKKCINYLTDIVIV